jgi:hypothetical protein
MGNLFREELVKKEEKKKKLFGEDLQIEVEPPDSLFENLSNLFKAKTSPKKKKKDPVVVEEVSEKIEEQSDQPLGLLANPPDVKTPDPLTPLDQNFVTKKEMENHYKLFLNRIQQQLSTLGGGGEANITFLDTPVTLITDSSYQVKSKDYYIGVNYEGVATITLPSPTIGKRIVVKDESGKASYKNREIRIVPLSGSDTIDSKDAAIINLDHGSLTFIYREGWRII